MTPSLHRRDFLKTATISLAGLGFSSWRAAAGEAFQRAGKPRLQLSLAAYSFRQFFKDGQSAKAAETGAPAKQIDLFDFVNYCAEQGCSGAEVTSYYFPKAFDDAFLIRLRRHAFLRGIALSGTAVGNTF